MQRTITLATIMIAAGQALAASCQNSPGVANGECVKYYSGFDCQGTQEEGSYKPTCGGNCFVYNFDSLFVAGDGTYGTDCYAYSDSNCQDYIGATGNDVTGFGACKDFSGGNSMKCYYRC